MASTRQLPGVFATAARNRSLLRVGAAFAAFNGAEVGAWIALLLFAYEDGGVAAASAIALVQLIPGALLAPWLGSLGDRWRPGRVLLAGYLALAASIGAVAAIVALDGPSWTVFALAPIVNLAVCVPRPAQAALLPSVVRSAEELTAANAGQGSLENASMLIAPLYLAVLLSLGGTGLALAGMALLALVAALAVSSLPGPPPFQTSESDAVVHQGARTLWSLRAVSANPATRVLLLALGGQFLLLGAVDLLAVILAVEVLETGEAGAGYLTAAVGTGGLLAIFVTASLVGRRRLAPVMIAGGLGAAGAMLLLAAHTTQASALILFAAIGLGRSVFDVTGRTLLQRTASPAALAGVFALLESLMNFGLAAGSLLVPLLVELWGATAALVGTATLVLALLLLSLGRLRQLDASADVPVVEMSLLRTIPLFAPLPAPSLETLARAMSPMSLSAGTVLIRQGDSGDCYYAIADGELDIVLDGTHVGVRRRGEGVGEIALIMQSPRTATVTAREDAELYVLERDPFLFALTGHPSGRRMAQAVVEARHAELARATVAD